MIATSLHPVQRALQRRQWQDEIILRDAAIVYHAAKWRLVPTLVDLSPVSIDGVDDDVATRVVAIAACLVAETNHLAGDGIELRMCSERRRDDLSIEVIPTDRLQSRRVHGERRSIFFHRQQRSTPEDDIRIGRRANNAFHQLIVGVQIAISAKQRPALLGLMHIALGLDIPLFEVHVAVLDPESSHCAIAIEVDVVLEDGRVPVVWLDAIECPIDIRRDDAVDFEIEDLAFEP